MKEKLALAAAVLFSAVWLHGQNPGRGLVFQTREWDFGSLLEEDGAVEHDFPFRNSSGSAFRIGTVSVSCSCLQASFPHEEIPAGGTGAVTLRMSPAGAAGKTRRHADVYAADGTYLGRLVVAADIRPMDVELEQRYRSVLGPRLRTLRTSLPFGYVRKDSLAREELFLANPSAQSVRVTAQSALFTVEGPEIIPPRGEARWTVSCAPREAYSILRDSVRFFTDGVPAEKAVAVSAICLGPASNAKASLWTTPSEGKMRRGKGRLKLGNSGEEDLVILGLDAPEGVRLNLHPGMRLPAGKELEVKASSNLQTFDINIFTNDPQRPVKTLRFAP